MSQNLTVWKYNNIELELDLADVTDAKRYNDAYVALDNEEKAMKKDVPNYVFIQNYCAMFEHLFDSLFGDGTYEKLTGGRTSMLPMKSTRASSTLPRHRRITPCRIPSTSSTSILRIELNAVLPSVDKPNILIDTLPETVEVNGRAFSIRTDFRIGIMFELMVFDQNLSDDEKVENALELYS